MVYPDIPSNENERMAELLSLSILDTLPEEEYDDITIIASQICNTPISLISLVDKDRQWFKSHHGLDATETPRKDAFCAHAINVPDEMLIVPDSRQDNRFFDNPLVTDDPEVVFYAGVPLVAPNGTAVGTLCVIDNEPRELSAEQLKSLNSLAHQVVRLFELRKSKTQLEVLNQHLENKNVELEQFARVAAHDIKSPLNSITGLIDLVLEKYKQEFSTEVIEWLMLIGNSATQLRSLVTGILEYSRSDELISTNKEEINLETFFSDLATLVNGKKEHDIIFTSPLKEIYANKVAVEQILINLIVNAIKYCDKDHVIVQVSCEEVDNQYLFSIKDNGPGIKKEHQEKIFRIFEILQIEDRNGQRGSGIGLATVKKLVRALGGKIKVDSQEGKGSTFSFSISK